MVVVVVVVEKGPVSEGHLGFISAWYLKKLLPSLSDETANFWKS